MPFLLGLFGLMLIWLAIQLWPLVVGGLVIYLVLRALPLLSSSHRASEARDRRRHQRARRQIDDLARAGAAAMYAAAARHGDDVIDSTAVEVRQGD